MRQGFLFVRYKIPCNINVKTPAYWPKNEAFFEPPCTLPYRKIDSKCEIVLHDS